MKTCALYGFISALAAAFLTLALYFLGFHSDLAKLPAANWIGGLGGLTIGVTCTALGVKARRAEVPAGEDFGYGRALGAGVVVSAVGAVLTSIFTYVYYAYINPGFSDILLQNQLSKLEASGMSGDRLDKAEALTRTMLKPVPEALFTLLPGLVFGLIIALILAAILKRPAASPSRT